MDLNDEHCCECGQWSGNRCYAAYTDSSVVVEFMPQWLRASHVAAGGGGRGVYPHNGARRINVTPACAEFMREADPEWVEIVVGERS